MISTPFGGCQGATFFTLGLNFIRVCGQILGYQQATPAAFYPYSANNNVTIDGVYVEGVSITYGNAPRKHIWTYANGIDLRYNPSSPRVCPCNIINNVQIPPYVGSNYYCETGAHVYSCCSNRYHLYLSDPLWDGQHCASEEAPCCTHTNMPWFLKMLNETTTEDIELRVCGDEDPNDEDTPLQVVELFVY